MSKSLINTGVFIDISVPKKHAQAFLTCLKDSNAGCQIDYNNCAYLEDGYQIRITCKVLTQAACLKLIKDIALQLGIEDV